MGAIQGEIKCCKCCFFLGGGGWVLYQRTHCYTLAINVHNWPLLVILDVTNPLFTFWMLTNPLFTFWMLPIPYSHFGCCQSVIHILDVNNPLFTFWMLPIRYSHFGCYQSLIHILDVTNPLFTFFHLPSFRRFFRVIYAACPLVHDWRLFLIVHSKGHLQHSCCPLENA
jgi:hypothetical protein